MKFCSWRLHLPRLGVTAGLAGDTSPTVSPELERKKSGYCKQKCFVVKKYAKK